MIHTFNNFLLFYDFFVNQLCLVIKFELFDCLTYKYKEYGGLTHAIFSILN